MPERITLSTINVPDVPATVTRARELNAFVAAYQPTEPRKNARLPEQWRRSGCPTEFETGHYCPNCDLARACEHWEACAAEDCAVCAGIDSVYGTDYTSPDVLCMVPWPRLGPLPRRPSCGNPDWDLDPWQCGPCAEWAFGGGIPDGWGICTSQECDLTPPPGILRDNPALDLITSGWGRALAGRYHGLVPMHDHGRDYMRCEPNRQPLDPCSAGADCALYTPVPGTGDGRLHPHCPLCYARERLFSRYLYERTDPAGVFPHCAVCDALAVWVMGQRPAPETDYRAMVERRGF